MGPNANQVIDWLAETGEANGLDGPEWRERLSSVGPWTDEERDVAEATLMAFTRTRPKEELVAQAQERALGWAPVFSPREIVDSKQLAARDYWVRVQHDDIGETFVYPGAPFLLSETPWQQRGRAPQVGEHNEAVYGGLLGLSAADLRALKMRMTI